MRTALAVISILTVAHVSEALGGARLIAAIPMSWAVEKIIDTNTDARFCLVVSHGRDVTARLAWTDNEGTAAWTVIVGHGNSPGSLRYLRIGKSIYTSARPSFRGQEAREIVARLRSPGDFVYEWAQSPGHTKRGGLYGTGDFAAKAAKCESWIRGAKI